MTWHRDTGTARLVPLLWAVPEPPRTELGKLLGSQCCVLSSSLLRAHSSSPPVPGAWASSVLNVLGEEP